LSIVAIIGIVASLLLKTPIPAIVLLLSTVFYEIYCTEGASTKISSVIFCIILFLELVLIIGKIDLDLSKLLGEDTKYIVGYEVPLGLLTIVGPTAIAVLAVIPVGQNVWGLHKMARSRDLHYGAGYRLFHQPSHA
jgi:hypothetical protein